MGRVYRDFEMRLVVNGLRRPRVDAAHGLAHLVSACSRLDPSRRPSFESAWYRCVDIKRNAK